MTHRGISNALTALSGTGLLRQQCLIDGRWRDQSDGATCEAGRARSNYGLADYTELKYIRVGGV